MLQYGNLSLGFPAPQFFIIEDEIALMPLFYRDENNTSIISIKDATLDNHHIFQLFSQPIKLMMQSTAGFTLQKKKNSGKPNNRKFKRQKLTTLSVLI
jgi:hypothetical protein